MTNNKLLSYAQDLHTIQASNLTNLFSVSQQLYFCSESTSLWPQVTPPVLSRHFDIRSPTTQRECLLIWYRIAATLNEHTLPKPTVVDSRQHNPNHNHLYQLWNLRIDWNSPKITTANNLAEFLYSEPTLRSFARSHWASLSLLGPNLTRKCSLGLTELQRHATEPENYISHQKYRKRFLTEAQKRTASHAVNCGLP